MIFYQWLAHISYLAFAVGKLDSIRRSSIMAECRFQPLWEFEIGNDVVNQLSIRGFQFVFDWRLPSIFYRFKALNAFSLAVYSGMTISAARGRAKPEMTSSFDKLTRNWFRPGIRMFNLSISHAKHPLRIWGRDSPPEIFLFRSDHQKAPYWVKLCRTKHRRWKLIDPFDLWTWRKRSMNKKTLKRSCP